MYVFIKDVAETDTNFKTVFNFGLLIWIARDWLAIIWSGYRPVAIVLVEVTHLVVIILAVHAVGNYGVGSHRGILACKATNLGQTCSWKELILLPQRIIDKYSKINQTVATGFTQFILLSMANGQIATVGLYLSMAYC